LRVVAVGRRDPTNLEMRGQGRAGHAPAVVTLKRRCEAPRGPLWTRRANVRIDDDIVVTV